MRHGYYSEYKTKKYLEGIYGATNLIKIAISQQGADYLVVGEGKLLKIVEVKECHKKNYYPSKKERMQFERIVKFAKQHKIPAELWIYKYKGKGYSAEKDIQILK